MLLIDGCQTLLLWGLGRGKLPNLSNPNWEISKTEYVVFPWSLSQPLSCTLCLLLLTFYQNQKLSGYGSPAIILSLYAKLRRAPGHQITGEEPSDLELSLRDVLEN